MQHTRAPLAVKSVLFSVLAVALSGCSTLWNIDEDAPPPPPVREIRQLRIPADLNRVLPAPNPYTTAVATAQAVSPPQSPSPQVVVPIPQVVVPAVVVPESAKPVVSEIATKKEVTLFAPYFPSESEKAAPPQWEMGPSTVFPWVAGAEPSRVNEETVLGAGDQMIGRFFALVSYENNIPLPVVKAAVPVVTVISPKRAVAGAVKIEPLVEPEPVAPIQEYVRCDGATCLDAARDALVADARVKGWEMLLNRRVSLHQSFQFRKNNRTILIDVISNGKKKLDIEYSLLPSQMTMSRN